MAKPALDQALRLLYLLTVHLAPVPVDTSEISLRSVGPTGALVRLTDGTPPVILDAARATGAGPHQLAALGALLSSGPAERRLLTADLDGGLGLDAAIERPRNLSIEQPRDLVALCHDIGHPEAGRTLVEAVRAGGWQLCGLGVECTRTAPRPHRIRVHVRCDDDLPRRLAASARSLTAGSRAAGIRTGGEILRLVRPGEPAMVNLCVSRGRPSVEVEIPDVALVEVAALRLDAAEQRWVRRLNAAAQRLGPVSRVTDLGVRWSVGRRELYGNLPAGATSGPPPVQPPVQPPGPPRGRA